MIDKDSEIHPILKLDAKVRQMIHTGIEDPGAVRLREIAEYMHRLNTIYYPHTPPQPPRQKK